MESTVPGLFKASLASAYQAFRINFHFRAYSIALVLLSALASAFLANADETARKAVFGSIGPSALALFFIPFEFLLYDMVLKVKTPKTSLLRILFDVRVFSYLWRYVLIHAAFLLPAIVVGCGMSFLRYVNENTPLSHTIIDIAGFAVLSLLLIPAIRFMFFPVLVALGRPKPLRTSCREMKGNVWKVSRAMFLPMLFIALVCMLGIGIRFLTAEAGAPMSVFISVVTTTLAIFLVAIETILFAHAYQRMVQPVESENQQNDVTRLANGFAPAPAQSGENSAG